MTSSSSPFYETREICTAVPVKITGSKELLLSLPPDSNRSGEMDTLKYFSSLNFEKVFRKNSPADNLEISRSAFFCVIHDARKKGHVMSQIS